jgi:hypothetical protein
LKVAGVADGGGGGGGGGEKSCSSCENYNRFPSVPNLHFLDNGIAPKFLIGKNEKESFENDLIQFKLI